MSSWGLHSSKKEPNISFDELALSAELELVLG